MILAESVALYPNETRADLQRYFGLNLSRLGTDFDAFHAGACLSCLPLGSKLLARYVPEASWTVAEHKLHAILSALAGEVLPYPWDEADPLTDSWVALEGLPVEEFGDWLNQEWKEVSRGVE